MATTRRTRSSTGGLNGSYVASPSANGVAHKKDASVTNGNGVNGHAHYLNGDSAAANGKSANGHSHSNGYHGDEVHRVSNGKSHSSSVNGNGVSHHHDNGAVPLSLSSTSTSSGSGWASALGSFLHHTVVPLLLMVCCPNIVILLWYTAARCGGSFAVLGARLTRDGLVPGIAAIWTDVHVGSALAAGVIGAYMLWAVLLMKLVPGRLVEGPVTPKGHVPVYKDNGFSCYCITLAAFAILTVALKSYGLSPTIVYDHFDEFLGTLTVYSHVICLIVCIKGLYFPSTADHGSSGNALFDYYWGTELYPRIFGIDIKVFTNCRFGMTVWPLLVLIFALKSYEMHGFVDSMWVSAVLQLVYFTKFFWWESGYMCTIDIMLDRAGFYICWGCLAFIPGFYASVSMYLVEQPLHLGHVLSVAILVAGSFCTAINYLADEQKQRVRRSRGQCLVWGKRPLVIQARYRLETGEEKQSLLLASGWWKLARHFHYVPEMALAFLWTVPALFTHVMPYTYFIWLSVLLIHRSFRDEAKCSSKYGAYWKQYCAVVPWRICPGIF